MKLKESGTYDPGGHHSYESEGDPVLLLSCDAQVSLGLIKNMRECTCKTAVLGERILVAHFTGTGLPMINVGEVPECRQDGRPDKDYAVSPNTWAIQRLLVGEASLARKSVSPNGTSRGCRKSCT